MIGKIVMLSNHTWENIIGKENLYIFGFVYTS